MHKERKGTKQKTLTISQIIGDDETTKGSSDEAIPDRLKIYISQEIWNSWSPIRRESFKQIIKNPNSFFYRNRPPGDPQKYGSFTADEEKLFLDRLNYFRNSLRIEDGLWGLFSVPMKGRVGYQCSNFYRLLIKSGKVVDDHYEIQEDGKLKFLHGNSRANPSESVVQSLEKEAFEFIENCLNPENGSVPQVSRPIMVQSDPQKAPNNPNPNPNPRPRISIRKASKELARYIGIKRQISEKKHMLQPISGGAKSFGRFARDYKPVDNRYECNTCPLYGAIDPMSSDPMENPMMDIYGFVMDLKSWRRVFRHNDQPPCEMVATDESDLIELTQINFNLYRQNIVNFVC